jgi:gliding motility-associated-like protein
MIVRHSDISVRRIMERGSFILKTIVLCGALMIIGSGILLSQVITNEGAAINILSGTVVGSKDANNYSGGLFTNSGEFNLSGSYTSTANTNGNGFFRIGSNWTNTGGIFVPGSSTVIFNGSDNQLITRTGGESFFNLSVFNTGAPLLKSVGLSNNVNVLGTLTMSAGNVDAGTYVLYLSNPLAAALNYTSTTGSRIFGRFERGISQTANYLFPLGTTTHYNPARLIMNNVVSTGSVLSRFFSADPGNGGLPIPDPPVEIGSAYPGGYWSFISNSFSSSDFNVNLDASGFLDGGGIPDTIRDITRVIKRTNAGNWTVDGAHVDATGTVVVRNNLTGDISPLGTDFALGRARPLITSHPVSLIQCEHTNAIFSVTATGAAPLTYRWYKDGVIVTNGPDYSGARTNTLTVIDINLVDAGTYYCEISDRYRNKTRSNDATLIVNKIPVATVTPSIQSHECSNIAFDNIVLGETYGVPGTTYVWTRDNPAGITTAIPLSGTAPNIGDVLAGMFDNITDAPLVVTFTVTPVGPPPTFCVGLPVVARVTVNPTPRVVPVNNATHICYDGTTQITLTTPTTMTRGTIQFDYFVTISSAAIVGNTAPENDRPIDYNIARIYQNTSDTMHSVFYHVTPKNVISGCNSGTIMIPEVKVHPRALQNMYISVPFTCTGGSAGVLTSVLSKTSKPDQIHWSRPWRPDTIYNSSANTDNLNIHFAGVYKVTVKDSLGCTNASNNLFVSGAVFNSSLYVKQTDTGYGTSCRDTSDGEIWIWEETSSTGVPPFEFWLVRNGVDTVGHDTLVATGYANRVELKSLQSGHYQLFIRDANGCYNGNYPSADIEDPDPIEVTFDKKVYSGFNVSCLNYSDGKTWVKTITGGNGSYKYKWTTFDGLITGPDTLSVIDSIPAGTYYLLTTDLHNCPMQDTVTLIEPTGISLSDTTLSMSPDNAFNIACAGYNTGSISITVAGGSGNYNYSWSGPGSFSAATKNISNLITGTYVATITDQSNPTCILAPQPAFTLTEPAPLAISSVKSLSIEGSHNINCHGGTGSVDITVTGGSVGTYQYTWSTTDGSGIVPGSEDQAALTAGTYHLAVRDANNCTASTDITLTEPSALAATLTPTHITCSAPLLDNGSVNLTVNGGVTPYTYSWSTGATTEDISGLTQGYYRVTIKDANNCALTDSVKVNLPPPLQYTKSLSVFNGYNVSCNGSTNGAIDITVTSGQSPYVFNWQKAGGGFTATTEDISGLKAGQYILLITDANSCTATETIDITEPGKLSMNFNLSSSTSGGFNINCAGTSAGSIDVVPVNQVGTVTYLWSDGETSKTRTSLPAGDYSVIITDSNNCPADSSVILTEPDSLKLVFDVTQPWCPDKPDGEIRLTASGGVVGTDYTYKWSDNSTNRDITNILSGLFRVTVTDLNGCSIRDSVNVEPERETCLIIPNAISPNGDLINDEWNIGLIDLYPQVEIKIFNRWGELIWNSAKGYPEPWNGRSNGRLLPVDSYHYIIDLNNGSKPILGNVTIVR